MTIEEAMGRVRNQLGWAESTSGGPVDAEALRLILDEVERLRRPAMFAKPGDENYFALREAAKRENDALVRAEAAESRVRALEDALRKHQALWDVIRDDLFHCGDIDGGTMQDAAVAAGLLVEVAYDPEKHGDIEDVEPGEQCFVDAKVAAKALALGAKP